jgi:hypothetical protein
MKANLKTEIKICNRCKRELPIGEYYKDKSRCDGLQSACKSCFSEMGREYRQKNKEKIAEKNREYYQQNKEKTAEVKREYYQQNKEKIAERGRKYYQQNKEKIAEKNREYYQENKEKKRKYYQEHKEKKRKYYQENKEKIAERYREYRQKNKDLFRKYRAKRKRNLGFRKIPQYKYAAKVFEHSNTKYDWHHTTDENVLPLPRSLHKKCYAGSNKKLHRLKALQAIKILYMPPKEK